VKEVRISMRTAVAAVVCALSVLAGRVAVAAQLNLHHYDTRDGIPQIQVSAVHQDASGYLWLGTYGGLARYNGHEFQVFADDSGLSTSYINVVDSDLSGTVWVGTARGLCRRGGERFECFNPPGIDQVMVNDIALAPGGVWVGADEGLFLHAGQGLAPVPAWSDVAGEGGIHSLELDGDGRLWIAAQSGLFRLEEGRLAPVPLSGYATVHELEFHGERLWAAPPGQLLSLDAAGRSDHRQDRKQGPSEPAGDRRSRRLSGS
jgi:ligand-binding sensor domain-containing protein